MPNRNAGKTTPVQKVRGQACFIKAPDGKFIDNIDTDMIFHNAHLAVTDISQMGQYALGNLSGWTHFPSIASKFEVLVVGSNFGAGSSRQQAVDCFKALGIRAILAQSFAPIYFRNAVNSGMFVLTYENACPEARSLLESLQDGVELSLTPTTGEVALLGGKTLKCDPLPSVLVSITAAGGLFEYAREKGW